MSENKNQAGKLCLKCHLMYGNHDFNEMCSLCYKQTLAEAKCEVDKEERQLNKETNKIIELLGKKTETEKVQKEGFKEKIKQDIAKIISAADKQQSNVPKNQIKKQLNKCARCCKKVGMLGYNCKHCTNEFCKIHRLPEDHDCGVDFISLGRKQLKLDNPTIQKTKIQKI